MILMGQDKSNMTLIHKNASLPTLSSLTSPPVFTSAFFLAYIVPDKYFNNCGALQWILPSHLGTSTHQQRFHFSIKQQEFTYIHRVII